MGNTSDTHGEAPVTHLEDNLGCVLDVIPVFVVKVLPEELNGGLGTIDFLLWHVHVINEDDSFLAHGRPKESLATLVHLGHDDELETRVELEWIISR